MTVPEFTPAITSVVLGIVANIVFTLGLALSIWLATSLLWRRDVRAFFGLTPRRGSVTILLSNIRVNPNGTTGTDPIAQGFFGAAITELEYRHSLLLANSIQTRPISRLVRELIASVRPTTVEPVVCRIEQSMSYDPLKIPVVLPEGSAFAQAVQDKLKGGTYIIVGGPIYNVMTHYVLNHSQCNSPFHFLRDVHNDHPRRGITVIRDYSSSSPERDFIRLEQADKSRTWYTDYCIVEKISGWNGSTIFICAGTCTAATVAALVILADWRHLARKYGSKPFSILYRVTTNDREGEPDRDKVQVEWVGTNQKA